MASTSPAVAGDSRGFWDICMYAGHTAKLFNDPQTAFIPVGGVGLLAGNSRNKRHEFVRETEELPGVTFLQMRPITCRQSDTLYVTFHKLVHSDEVNRSITFRM